MFTDPTGNESNHVAAISLNEKGKSYSLINFSLTPSSDCVGIDPQFCPSTLTFYPMGVTLTYRSHMGPLGAPLTLVGFRASSGHVCGPLSAYVVHF